MKVDLDLALLATTGAGLLAAAGALLRSAFQLPPVPREPLATDPKGPPEPNVSDGSAELSALRQELSAANAAREAQRIEMVELRQRSERQVHGAQAEIQRLSGELDAERAKSSTAEATVKELRSKLSAAEDDVRRSKWNASDPKALVALQSEVTESQKKLKTVTEERDSARAKIEALERLVEGVRARSRELSEELKALKGQ